MLYNKQWDISEPAKILYRAADIIEKAGHIKGRFHIDGNGYCAKGAMMAAIGVEDEDMNQTSFRNARSIPAFEEAFQSLSKSVNVSDFASWNNQHKRTGKEVIAKMREVAHSLEAVVVTA